MPETVALPTAWHVGFIKTVDVDRKSVRFYLTDKERLILNRLAQGHTYADIGRELHVSRQRVGKHMQQIRSKIAANTRCPERVAVLVAPLQGFFSPPRCRLGKRPPALQQMVRPTGWALWA